LTAAARGVSLPRMAHIVTPWPRVVVVGMYVDRIPQSPDALLAGGWRNFGRTAAAARRAGAEVTMVQAACEDAEREIDGVRCYFVRERGDPFLRLSGGRTVRRQPRRLLERVSALAPELIHFEGLWLPRQVRALAAVLPGVPIVAQDHGTKCPGGWRRWWYRWGFAPLAGVAFTARAQAAAFFSAGVFRPGLPVFEVVGMSSPFTPGDQHAAQSATGLNGDPCLFWAGNLDANKDPLTVLAAVAQVTSELPGLRLHMCYRRAAQLDAVRASIAADPALAAHVRLLGEVPHAEIEMHYRAADFLVQASHAESCGGTLIEALACGTTPLVTDIPSFRRITGQGACGALSPVGDAAALARAIREWYRRDRPTLRRRAREHFERDLSVDAVGRQLCAAYEALR
jgi:glycosyltransferase involved in cell wall biosynthesis